MLRIPHLSLTGDAFQRTLGSSQKMHLSRVASDRSRKLGTAFRSLATTLSPPLRGRSSQPAPSIPHNSFSRPVRSQALRSTRFRSRAGRIPNLRPVVNSCLLRSCGDLPSPLPFGLFQPSGSKRSTVSLQETHLTGRPIAFRSPQRFSFDGASDQCSKLASPRLAIAEVAESDGKVHRVVPTEVGSRT